MIKKIIHILSLTAFFTLIMCGCSDDIQNEDNLSGEGNLVEVKFSLSARPNNHFTRAEVDSRPVDPVDNNEKINDWFIIFVDNNKIVRKILTRTEAGNSGAVEQETFTCILPTGTYSVYAFANISTDQLKKATGIQINGEAGDPDVTIVREKGTLTDEMVEAIRNATWEGDKDGSEPIDEETSTILGSQEDVANVSVLNNDNLNLWNTDATNGKAIPMTGYQVIKVRNVIEETFSIEVVRMLAKIELRFLNPTDKDVRVNGIYFSPVTVSPVSLFPKGNNGIGDYSFLGNGAFTPLADAKYARLTYPLTQPVSVAKASSDDNGNTVNGTNSLSFFIKETLSHTSGGFTIWLNVAHEGGVSEYLQYCPTVDITGYINRNDWIVIPVTLSQYDANVEAVFYPPIGGYPPITTGGPDGSQEFTFGTQGVFSLNPYVIDKLTGEYLSTSRYSVEVSEILSSTSTTNINWNNASKIYPDVTTDKGIFTTMPVKVEPYTLPYELIGELNTTQGSARIKLAIKVYAESNSNGTAPKHTYYKYVYIIRKNP